jgi:hypothetical protein
VVYPSILYLDTFRIWVCVWEDLLNPAVMSYRTSLPSFMMLSLACGLVLRVLVFHPSICELTVVDSMLWFEQGLVWWTWLIPSGDVVSLAQIC